MAELKKGTKPVCPHCDKEQEYPVEDYVVAGVVGYPSLSEEQCGYCDGAFTIMLAKDGKYLVEAIEPEEAA